MKFVPPTLRGTIVGFLVLVPLLYIVPLALIGRWRWEAAGMFTGPVKAAQIWIAASIVAWPFTILPTLMAALSYFFLARHILDCFGDRIRTRFRLVVVCVIASGACCAIAGAITILISFALSPREINAPATTLLGWAAASFSTGALIGAVFGLSAVVAPDKRTQSIARKGARSG